MKILMLAWEYPPQVVGGLGRHVADLSEALVGQGHEVHVLTGDAPGVPPREERLGVHVHRQALFGPAGRDFVESVIQLNVHMLEACLGLIRAGHDFDLIHGHDWLSVYAGKALKHGLVKPLVATIHATEFGRNHGLHNELQRQISNLEWWLTYEAWRVVCCSEHMAGELQYIFQVPRDKLRILPNGVKSVDLDGTESAGVRSFRRQYAADTERVVFFVGRLVPEKGVDTLIDSIPSILSQFGPVKFIIAGTGPAEQTLRGRVRQLGITQNVYFTGFVDDATRNRLYACADVAVVPSHYEPFGIVALEAMAARVPVVVSDIGGLAEIVRHAQNGLRAYPGNSQSLADNILAYLKAPQFARYIKEQAFREVRETYNWPSIAQRTAVVYREVLTEFAHSPWAQRGSFDREGILAQTRLTTAGAQSRYQDTRGVSVPTAGGTGWALHSSTEHQLPGGQHPSEGVGQ